MYEPTLASQPERLILAIAKSQLSLFYRMNTSRFLIPLITFEGLLIIRIIYDWYVIALSVTKDDLNTASSRYLLATKIYHL